MPKETFLNLPEHKRDRIVELAIEEFSERPYRQASLSRIVARAGIAKGSIYQYFDNKLDLYRWLLTDELARRKMAAINAAAPPPGTSTFDILAAACRSGIAFAIAEPRLAQLGARFMRDVDGESELQAIAIANKEAGHAWLKALLQAGQVSGELSQDLDLDIAAVFIANVLGEGLLELLAYRLGVDFASYIRQPDLTATLSRSSIDELVESVLTLLKHGLGARGKNS